MSPFLPFIEQTLSATQAQTRLCVGLTLAALPHTETALEIALKDALSYTIQSRYDLALVEIAPDMSATDAKALIAKVRDVWAQHSVFFIPSRLLDENSLLGLGLSKQAAFDYQDIIWQAWSFDIRHYKSVPDWLNPKYWANPENWEKYRW
jgi:hypothetical protein